MAGLARDGHAARVAALSVEVGDAMGLRRSDIDDLRAAALLHHLGHLCLDAPEMRDEPIEPFEVADKGAEILRQTDLALAGDLLATDAVTVGGQILRLASAYDDLRDDHTVDDSLDALAAGPGFLYDRRVLDAFERVVTSAG
jgi:HD-GYP domain-containing protein (c-di-GMP phosphodiesterase class II)